MDIKDFVCRFKNYPILFIGTGFSLRYLHRSYSWDELLKKIAFELYDDNEHYYDLKAESRNDNGTYDFSLIAEKLEVLFNEIVKTDRTGKFKTVNDIFYDKMSQGIQYSRFKIYIVELLNNIQQKVELDDELSILKKAMKNVSSIITTNYDKFIECCFNFQPLIGNDIMLSNPYGSLYKIHGCIDHPDKIIITKSDYNNFETKYELIRAQLLSLFIHNPIIFIGYNIGDENIKKLLKTIFTYVEPNSEQAKSIRSNFLLIEHDANSQNTDVVEHDIEIDGFLPIRINKLKTDNFSAIYEAITKLQLAISAMDIRKVQTVIKDILEGGDIKVRITEDIDALENKDKVLVIGSPKTVTYYTRATDYITNYFRIIEDANEDELKLIDKLQIQSSQYFPIFAFLHIYPSIQRVERLKKSQIDKLKAKLKKIKNTSCINSHTHIEEIDSDENISSSNKIDAILYGILRGSISKGEAESFLQAFNDRNETAYRKLICAYDYAYFSGGENLVSVLDI